MIKDSFVRWRQLANRHLFNARDSALSFTVGARPRAQTPPGDDPKIFDTDADRISSDDIQALLDGLRHNGAVIGVDHWGSLGRDRGLVCVLTRSSGRSVAPDDFFVASLAKKKTRERAAHGPQRQLELVPIDLPKEGDDLNWLVFLFAHECGHAFGLGDEYGEPGAKKGGVFDRADETDTAEIEAFPNLHARETLRKAGAPNEIDASLVKWASWLRVSHAAVVTARPAASVTDNELRLEVRAGATRFGVGERVRVRQVLLRRNAEHLLEYRDPQRSGPLKVKARPPDDTHLVLEPDGAPGEHESALADIGTTVMDDIDEAPVIVYRPTRHPIPGSVAPTEVAVLSPIVAVHMSTTDRPLNVKADEPYVCVIDHSRRAGAAQPAGPADAEAVLRAADHRPLRRRSPLPLQRLPPRRRVHDARRERRRDAPAVLPRVPVRARRDDRPHQARRSRRGVLQGVRVLVAEQHGTLELVAGHLARAMAPLGDAVSSIQGFRAFMLRLGWHAEDLPPAYAALASTVDSCLAAVDALSDDPQIEEVLALLDAAAAVYRALDDLDTAPAGVEPDEFLADLAERVFELLRRRLPHDRGADRVQRARGPRRHRARVPPGDADPTGLRAQPPAPRGVR